MAFHRVSLITLDALMTWSMSITTIFTSLMNEKYIFITYATYFQQNYSKSKSTLKQRVWSNDLTRIQIILFHPNANERRGSSRVSDKNILDKTTWSSVAAENVLEKYFLAGSKQNCRIHLRTLRLKIQILNFAVTSSLF